MEKTKLFILEKRKGKENKIVVFKYESLSCRWELELFWEFYGQGRNQWNEAAVKPAMWSLENWSPKLLQTLVSQM